MAKPRDRRELTRRLTHVEAELRRLRLRAWGEGGGAAAGFEPRAILVQADLATDAEGGVGTGSTEYPITADAEVAIPYNVTHYSVGGLDLIGGVVRVPLALGDELGLYAFTVNHIWQPVEASDKVYSFVKVDPRRVAWDDIGWRIPTIDHDWPTEDLEQSYAGAAVLGAGDTVEVKVYAQSGASLAVSSSASSRSVPRGPLLAVWRVG